MTSAKKKAPAGNPRKAGERRSDPPFTVWPGRPTPRGHVHDETDAHLAAELHDETMRALADGDRTDRLAEALRVLRGDSLDVSHRRAEFLAEVERLFSRLSERSSDSRLGTIPERLAEFLPRCDAAFRTLDADEIRTVLTDANFDNRLGGSGRTGPVGIAAELAVRAGAFDLGRRDDENFATAFERAVSAMKNAKKRRAKN